MKLSHFSDNPISEVYSEYQHTEHCYCGFKRFDKPAGFWVSVDGEDDWPYWCGQEGYRDIEAQYHYQVELAKESRILRLENYNQIVQFGREWCPPWMFDQTSDGRNRYAWGVDWARLAELYQGIIISPYSWDARADSSMNWYWGWDCASGCIWDASAIADLTLVRNPVHA